MPLAQPINTFRVNPHPSAPVAIPTNRLQNVVVSQTGRFKTLSKQSVSAETTVNRALPFRASLRVTEKASQWSATVSTMRSLGESACFSAVSKPYMKQGFGLSVERRPDSPGLLERLRKRETEWTDWKEDARPSLSRARESRRPHCTNFCTNFLAQPCEAALNGTHTNPALSRTYTFASHDLPAKSDS